MLCFSLELSLYLGGFVILMAAGLTRLFRENRRLEKRVRAMNDLAMRDTLTKLPNRRGVEAGIPEILRSLEKSAALVRRTTKRLTEEGRDAAISVAVLFIDIDDFKALNTALGHLEADQRLIRIAEILRATFRRQGDLIERTFGRYGGDEFIAFLLHATREGAVRKAEEFRQAVEDADLGCTVSIGIDWIDLEELVAIRSRGEDIAAFVRSRKQQANAAMYQAKEGGKNKVVNLRSQHLH